MKTKFSILSALFCIFTIGAWAQTQTTTDHVTLPDLTLNPGGDFITVTASVENISKYTAFGLDIYLPEGYEFVQVENDDEEMVYVEKGSACRSSQSVGSGKQSDGALRVYSVSLTSSTATFNTKSNEIFSFFIKATPYAKPGYADIQIKNCSFTTTDVIKYITDDLTIGDKISATGNVTASVTVSNTWSTFVSPCAAAIPEGVKAYRYKTLDTEENKVYLQEQSSFEAYVPYVLYSESAFSGTTKGTSTATEYESKVSADGTVTDGIYVGAVTKQSASAGYVLQNLTDGVKFYKIATGDEFTIPVGKCYLNPGSSTDSSKLSIAFEEADGINNVNANGEETIYDLSGRKLQNAQQRGIYIVNGKKVVK